jgi:hypothetical protein
MGKQVRQYHKEGKQFCVRDCSCDLVDRRSCGEKRDPRNHTKPHENNFYKSIEKHYTGVISSREKSASSSAN